MLIPAVSVLPLPVESILLLSLTLLAILGAKPLSVSKNQTNTKASLGVKNSPDSFSSDEMISVAVCSGVWNRKGRFNRVRC